MKSEIRDITAGIVLIIFVIAGYVIANRLDNTGGETLYGPDFFPKLVLIILGIFSAVLLVKGLLDLKRNESTSHFDKKTFIRVILYIILLICYVNLFLVIGFIGSTIIFLFIGQFLYGLRNWIQLIAISIIAPFALNYIFTVLFKIMLP